MSSIFSVAWLCLRTECVGKVFVLSFTQSDTFELVIQSTKESLALTAVVSLHLAAVLEAHDLLGVAERVVLVQSETSCVAALIQVVLDRILHGREMRGT